jgi:hypothetical protein
VAVESTVEAWVVVAGWAVVDGGVVDGAVVLELHAAATRISAVRAREMRDMEGENTDELICK